MKSKIFLAKIMALSILLSCGNEKRQDSETKVAPMVVIQAAAALYGAYSANRDHNALMGKFKDVQKSIIQSTNIIVDNMERINAQENLAEAVAFLDYFQSYNFNAVNNDLHGRGHSAIRQLERLAINSPHLYRVEAISLLNLVAPAQGVVMLRNGIAPSVIDASIMKIVYNVNDKYLESGVSDMARDLHSEVDVRETGSGISRRGKSKVSVYGVFSSVYTYPGYLYSTDEKGKKRLESYTKWVAPMFEIYRSVEAAQKDLVKLIPGGKVRA
ncbi:hypothetical protein MEO40_27615, partial [Dolichospermum sp. ST_sed1]|nr:hypothetical protein [Dolichospermum sp. ST_sed1]